MPTLSESREREVVDAPRVLLALLRDTPEEAFIHALRDAPLRLQEHRRRSTLLARLKMYQPAVLLLPVTDARGRPSAPLIAQCQEAVPTADIIVLGAFATKSRHILMALRHDVQLLMSPTEEAVMTAVLESAAASVPELPPASTLFAAVSPPFLRQMMTAGWSISDHALGIAAIAAELNVSPRTLAREAKRQRLAKPRDILSAIRFLRGYAFAASTPRHRPVDAAVGEEVLSDGIRTHLGLLSQYRPRAPLPPLVRALEHRVRALGGSVDVP